MPSIKKIGAIGLWLSPLCAFALEFNDIDPVVALRAGVNWIDVSENQVDTVGEGNDTYLRDRNETNAGWGIFLGGEWEFARTWFLESGLAYDFLDRTNIEGDILLAGIPDLNQVDYQYKLQHQRLNAEFKLLKAWQGWFPYLTGSLGIAWNKTEDYKEIASGISFATDFLEGQNTTDFTWSVGAGVERAFLDNWRVGLGYLYTDAGIARLKSKMTGDTLDQNFSTQQLILQVNYIFE